MATYDSMIDRTGADTLIRTEYSNQIIQDVVEDSIILRKAKRLPNMSSKMLSLPVLNSLPYAYFVNGDNGLKETTKVDWTNKVITAEEIAVVVPVPDAVIADASFDLWAQIRPLVRQAFGQTIDAAMLYGTNKPTTWPEAIVTDATAKSNVVTKSADGYTDIMGEGGLIALVEEDGYMVNGYVGSMQSRSYLRAIRDADGQPLFRNGMQDATRYTLDGQPIDFPRNGSIDSENSILIAGDWSQLVYAIRQDLTVTRSKDAVISDAAGKIIYNLYQQDMTALRFVMRLGFAMPTPVSTIGGADRYPFAVLKPAGVGA